MGTQVEMPGIDFGGKLFTMLGRRIHSDLTYETDPIELYCFIGLVFEDKDKNRATAGIAALFSTIEQTSIFGFCGSFHLSKGR